ncbi:multiple monosaccharide ABC transporter substrate-binding protein [Streptomyces sp. GC420]|uniref:multiple monosaccharide ABC transporter substrate-binding protein n=1 Tax=Streptomyces sp. GC420 TaxID=2697568 RepID=UPI00141500A5|nr:multiple monosaccharide ABC transporter substrate-binding protein [Streptomyces sp. GC420]NBM16919.1 substrate-binding domain-containing protein [Streptomyces sp. GC420]
MRTRITAAATVAAVLSLSLTACGEEDPGKGGDGVTSVGLAMPTRAFERWIADGDNMVEQLKGLGYETILEYADDDPEKQATQIEEMIDSGADALVVGAVDGRALADVLARAAKADIPVISYDRLILGSPDVDYYASFDNEKVGELQATYIVEKLGLVNGSADGPFNIEVFAGSSDDNNTRYFFQGAMNVLRPYITNRQLVVRSGETDLKQVATARWEAGTAKKRMNTLLASSYATEQVDAVLSPNDGLAIGILEALEEDGYGTDAKPLPIVTGQDADVASVKSISRGEQAMTVYKDTRKLAIITSSMVSSVLEGGKPVLNDTKTYDNEKKIVPSYLLDPVSVDKSNYMNILVHSGYIDAADLK